MTKKQFKKAEELALITSYIIREDLLNGTFFNTFDNAFKLAQEFLKAYSVDYLWGIEEEWDETVENFVNKRYINGKKI
jgi:hypothetical protein